MFLKNKLNRVNIRNNLKTLLPQNMGARSYIKRVQQKIGINNINLDRRKEEKKNTSLEISKDPFATKVIKNLIQTERELQKKIKRIQENEKLIKSKSYLKLFNKNPINLKKDTDIIKSKVNDLSKNKNAIISRADYINSEIFNLQSKKDIETGDFKNKILQNMNKLKSNLELLKEKYKSNRSGENLFDIKLVKLLDVKEEEKLLEEQKILALKRMRELEREDIKKRKEKNQEEILKCLKYRNVRPKKEYYLYEKLYNNYMDKEDNLIKKENAKRKAYMRHIDSQEFMEMEKNYIERRMQIEENIKESKHSLRQEWSERQKLIPSYSNPFIKYMNEEQEKLQQDKYFKLQQIIEHKNNMISFSNKIRKPQKWKEKLDNNIPEREKSEPKSKIFNQSLACKNEYCDKLRKKLMRKSRKSREKEENKKSEEKESNKKPKDILKIKMTTALINKNNSLTTNDYNIHNLSPIQKTERIVSKFNKKNEIQDYLAEKRKKPKPKLNNIYANDIKKFLKKSGVTENSLLMSKFKLDVLKEKKNQKDFFLEQNGGVANNPEIGEELFNLSLNIIKGKLAIIEEIEKNMVEGKEKDENESENDSEKEYVEQSEESPNKHNKDDKNSVI